MVGQGKEQKTKPEWPSTKPKSDLQINRPSKRRCDNTMELNKTSSAQTVASIDDLLIQIFLSIPLKPLVRLKLVSKHWNFIISGKNFNFSRNQNPNPAVGLIFLADVDKCHCSYIVSFDKQFNGRWPYVTRNSCNGLLLCESINYSNQGYYVCNPTTNKCFMLPKLDKPANCFDWMSLAFDPSKSPHYKVVCVTKHQYLNQNYYYLKVYSSETGCWRILGEPFSASVGFSRGGVYWNGAIHWISSTNTQKSLYFNPDNDQVPQVMPTPPMTTQMDPYWSYVYRYFGESCGHLHYVEDDRAVTELNVYEMRTDYSEWFLKYRVDCSLIENRLASIICALVRGKKDEDSFLVLHSEKRIIRYNLVYKTCETIHEKLLDEAGARLYPIWVHPLQYIESLSRV